ncbi:hypothetical protein HGG82_08095 [Marinomonas sp. M1K-6]|uniref:Uncharacterized protein n=1 Tax=Marinomonas profundi TaxID=2726122 RepID=A0A847QY01_9GAMM|nr:hypothetical protein [Marinomonas profundi]NLQ17589.1 hypothetical protein [Marinomonas profundi]UDV02195.1 hypothetical protein J8N69_11385 [Marinomonas profundi]
MATKTITIQTFTKDQKTGVHTSNTTEITGQTFTSTVGTLTREFIIHKDIIKTQKQYVLSDTKTGNRVGYLEVTNKKAATVDLAKHVLQALTEKYGPDRLTQVFHNADLQAGLEPQI